jgi:nitroimidazol reductase NimA-like FMN-containing flavoprotein (pyridoxamine 5'-phosphate oxidase superfamily)
MNFEQAERNGNRTEMSTIDEPILRDQGDETGAGDGDPPLKQRLAHLLHTERYAILCTQGEGQPYGSMVAFAATDDLRTMVFSTPVTTRKYRLLTACERVALVVDSRSATPDDVTGIEAVTATGRATRITDEKQFARWSGLLTDKHPYLEAFVHASSCALFRVDILRYLHVVHFQEVTQWTPNAG